MKVLTLTFDQFTDSLVNKIVVYVSAVQVN